MNTKDTKSRKMERMPFDEVTGRVIGCASDVHQVVDPELPSMYRPIWRLFLWAVAITGSLTRPLSGMDVEPAVQRELERKAVAQRERIRTARLELTRRFAVRAPGGKLLDVSSELSSVERAQISIDGEQRRFDRVTNRVKVNGPDGQPMKPVDKSGDVEARVVLTPDQFLFCEATEFEGPVRNSVRVGPRADAKPYEPMIFHVEMLGLIPMPSGLLYRTPVDAFYDVDARTECTIERERLDEVDTLKSSYVRADGQRVTFWIAPELGHSVLQTEFSSLSKKGKRRTQRVHSMLAQHGDVWFPSECEYTCYSDDELIAHELWVVKNAEFNSPIDPTVFTLAGLELSQGTYVVGDSGQRGKVALGVWDGEKLTDPPASPTVLSHPPPAPENRDRLLWIAALNAIAGMVLIGWYFRTRKRRQ